MIKKNVIIVQPHDQGDGDCAAPFCALQQAVAALEHQTGDVVIQLSAGRYQIKEPLVFTAHQLRNVSSLSLVAAEGQEVVFCGDMEIHPVWQPYEGDILVANIGEGLAFDALYVDGAQQILARYPNQQPGIVLGGYDKDCLSPERVARWKNPAGGFIRALHDREWGGNSYVITGKTTENVLETQWVGDNNRGCAIHTVKRMVENIFEELDSPGEWFYNRQTGQLFYYPPAGIALTTAVFSVATTAELIRLCGDSAQSPLRNVTLRGIRFEKTHRTLFTGLYERPLRGDWGMVRKGAVFMENTYGVTIQHCCFDEIGGNAVMLSGYNECNVINHCDFTHLGATGVLMMGKPDAVRDASCYDGDNHKTVITDFTQGPQSENYPHHITVDSCYFYDIGIYEKQTAAVCMSVSSHVTVRRNTVHHTARAGINVHDGTFGGHVIEHNDLFDCVTETADHGPINCWGRDRYWSVPQHDAMGYFGKEKRPFALLDACNTSTIRYNRVHANHAFGIDIDDGASNYDIYGNVCIGVGIKLRDGFDRKVHNNLLIGSGFELHMTFAQNNDLIFSNIVCNSRIFTMLCINEGATTFTGNNLYYNFGNAVASVPENDCNAVVADPLFENFEAGDYRLRGDSPALGQGFVPFPLKDADFGRSDKPKPPRYVYIQTDTKAGTQFYDVLLCNVTEGIRSAAGLPDYEGVYVAEREVLGLFCKLGLPIGVGDVIRKIGTQNIADTTAFLAAFAKIPLKTPIEIVFFRSQKPHTLEFIKETDDFTSIEDEAILAWQSSAPLLYQE